MERDTAHTAGKAVNRFTGAKSRVAFYCIADRGWSLAGKKQEITMTEFKNEHGKSTRVNRQGIGRREWR